MKKCDILIVGASTTGCWFAERMAREGFNVLVIEKELPENVSRSYDIFHMSKPEMEEFGLDIPEEDSPLREFAFSGSPMISPYGKYRKGGGSIITVGLHKHDYIMYMANKAKNSGTTIIYGASFCDLIYNEKGAVIGAIYEKNGKKYTVYSKIVADCSGIPSVARTRLPDYYSVENFKLTPRDIFYVVLYYVKYKDETVDPRKLDGFFMQYKSWSAPAGEGYDAILGIGGSYSYEYSEEVFNSQLLKNYKYPDYDILKVEKGLTPYHRSVYSFVDDGFIAMGDAACLTKPTCGEGCTSSLVQGEIAAKVITKLLNDGKPLTKKNLWLINKQYMVKQGKDFDSMRPLLMGIVAIDFDEAEYLFANDILFSDKILGGLDNGLELTNDIILSTVKGIVAGVLKKKIRPSTVGKILKGLMQSGEVGKLYDSYPESPASFPEWKEKADKLWNEIGSLADTCDPEILNKLGIK